MERTHASTEFGGERPDEQQLALANAGTSAGAVR